MARLSALALAILLLLPACRPTQDLSARPPIPAPAPPPPPPPPPPAPVAPARDSLLPVYQLLPRAEYGRLAPPVDGIPLSAADEDFTAAGVRVSALERLGEIAAQVGQERGLAQAPEIVASEPDRSRARAIPFRGNPSDVELVALPGDAKLYLPLGGDLMTPGNEVAVVSVEGQPRLRTRIRVGVRPQRLAVHPAGLVFVCNQYSNYLSIIDARRDELLTRAGRPVEIATPFYCTDLALVSRDPARPDADDQDLYVANRFRRSVLVYRIHLERDAQGAPVHVRAVDAAGAPLPEAPLVEIEGVGESPSRLSLDLASRSLYVANHRGGRLARIDLDSKSLAASFEAGAPTVDAVRAGQHLYVPTLMPDRGLLARGEPMASAFVQAAPLRVSGLDGALHVAHPGALFDGTRSYNFEDVRSGLFELEPGLGGAALYYTDDVSAEPNFAAGQKALAGALPQAIAASRAGDRLYLALGGSDLVQELVVDAAAPFRLLPGRSFATRERPFALALDEEGGRLFSAAWGGEVVEAFDLATGARLAEVDLGYAEPRYPASAIEEGERWFYGAAWSNNGRKTCAHCHYDELVGDGLAFSNGLTAPTALHRVKPNHDLLTTDSYFWNGSFANGSYRTLAFGAHIRSNCEAVLFGLVEGPASDPAARVGDPANAVSDGRDALCRPGDAPEGELPPNFAEIAGVIAAQNGVAAARVLAATGHGPDELSRRIDLYSAAELRLPPSPLRREREAGRLAPAASAELARGEALFASAGCAGCHRPDDPRHAFTNGADRGRGADWAARFAAAYAADPRVAAALPEGLPRSFLEAIRTLSPSPDVIAHLDPIDFFAPFCFGASNCLAFEDPLEAGLAPEEETRRLERLLQFQLGDPRRGFVPGNVHGQVAANVPSLRGVWAEAGLLHHGLARSLREAILAPGHPGLRAGERGYAVDAAGTANSHGFTSNLSAADVEALARYLSSLE